MLTETNLRELLGLKTDHPVLTIYLNTDPTEGSADGYRLSLRNMLKEINLPADNEMYKAFEILKGNDSNN